MPDYRRVLIALGVVLIGALLSGAAMSRAQRPARWPADDALFALPGWTVSPQDVQVGDGDLSTGALFRRVYRDAAGETLVLDVWSNPQPQAKMLFRKGPDRDFLGAGYVSESVSPDVVPPPPGGGALIARQGPVSWLLLYTYGERRGLLGNGARAWLFAEWDALLDAPNDYFMARLAMPFQGTALPAVDHVEAAAAALFPRLASWYADGH